MITDEQKRAIVRKFYSSGRLLSPSALENMTMEDADAALKQPAAAVVVDATPLEQYTVLEAQPKNPTTIADVAAFTHHRYETLRALLAAKVNAVSISHIPSFAEATVTGMVRDVTTNSFLLEDPTGAVAVHSSSPPVITGDVVSVQGAVRESRLIASHITFPDIPLARPQPHLPSPLTLSFLFPSHPTPPASPAQPPNPSVPPLPTQPESGLSTAQPPIPTAPATSFPPTPSSPANQPTTITCGNIHLSPTPPCRIRLPLDILVYRPPTPLTIEGVQHALVARWFPPAIPSGPDPLLLEPLPAVVWLQQDSSWHKSYKGVLVVSTAPGSSATIGQDFTVTISPAQEKNR